MAVTLYHSGQDNAPQITAASSLSDLATKVTNLFKKILVEGYGSTPAAGWTLVDEGDLTDEPPGHAIIVQNQAGEQFWIGPVRDEYDVPDNRFVMVYGASSLNLDLSSIGGLVNYHRDSVVNRSYIKRLANSANGNNDDYHYSRCWFYFRHRDLNGFSGNLKWLAVANENFIWFFGANDMKVPLCPVVFGTTGDGTHVVAFSFDSSMSSKSYTYFDYSVTFNFSGWQHLYLRSPQFSHYALRGFFRGYYYYLATDGVQIPFHRVTCGAVNAHFSALPGAFFANMHIIPFFFSFPDPLVNYNWTAQSAPITSLFEQITVGGKQMLKIATNKPLLISLEEEDWDYVLF